MEEYYYAVNARTGERSNLLHFIWEGDFDPVIKKREKQEEVLSCEVARLCSSEVKKGLTQIHVVEQVGRAEL
jgi:hypothetical protein